MLPDWIDKIENVDHAVALLDEEDEVAEDEHDQPDAAVLGSVDEPPDRRHRENTIKVIMLSENLGKLKIYVFHLVNNMIKPEKQHPQKQPGESS